MITATRSSSFLSLSRYFYRISKGAHFLSLLFGFWNRKCEYFEKKKKKKEKTWKESSTLSNEFPRDTYRDMLHDNGFCIKQCVFSQASTWTSNRITNDTVESGFATLECRKSSSSEFILCSFVEMLLSFWFQMII